MVSISFIIPVYNTAAVMLRRCIDSILRVVGNGDCEILVIDDGSDETDVKETLQCYQGCFVRYFRQENRGQAAARNVGLANATKEFIQFVDADDYLFPVNYKEVIKLAAYESADLVMFSYQKVSNIEPFLQERKGSKIWSGAGVDYLLSHSIFGVVWNCLIRRTAIGGLAFHAGVYHEDEEFAPLMILSAKKMVVTDYVCYAYYSSPNSTMTNQDIKHIDRRFADFSIVIDTLREKSMAMAGVSQAALDRRIDQLCQSFAYIVAKQSPDREFFEKWVSVLFEKNYLPLPDKKYNFKYSLSRKLTDSRGKLRLAYKVMHLL